MADATVAFIGGSGLYEMDGLAGVREVDATTPFGAPSDVIVLGTLDGTDVAFLPRHGRGHRIPPTDVPARANIYALKSLGVERIVSISAVGSLTAQISPLDLVVPDQIIDRTKGRPSTFFDSGIAVHVGFADPFCPQLSEALATAAREQPVASHVGGTYLVIEGPQFSTRAESQLYRSWGASVIGMTALPEAKLAREAEICYSVLALVADYDTWHETEEDVSVEMVMANLHRTVDTSRSVLRSLMRALPTSRDCDCGSALRDAIVTSSDSIGDDVRKRLAPIIGKYVGAAQQVV